MLNLGVFFTRHGQSLPVTAVASDYKPGDIVAWRLPDGRPHMGLVSDRLENGTPLMVHNIGAGARIENVLFTLYHHRPLPLHAIKVLGARAGYIGPVQLFLQTVARAMHVQSPSEPLQL